MKKPHAKTLLERLDSIETIEDIGHQIKLAESEVKSLMKKRRQACRDQPTLDTKVSTGRIYDQAILSSRQVVNQLKLSYFNIEDAILKGLNATSILNNK